MLAVSHHTDGLVLLDAGTGRELARDPTLTSISAITSIGSKDGQSKPGFVAAMSTGEILVLEVPSLGVLGRYQVSQTLVRSMMADPSGRFLYLLDQDLGVLKVDLGTGAVLGVIPLPHGEAFGLAVLDGGERIAVGGDFGVCVLRTETGEVLSKTGGFGRVLSLAADREGKRIVVGVEDGTMRVFDAATCIELLARRTNDNKVNAVVFLADGEGVAGGSTDMTVSVMRIADGSVRARMTGPSGSVLRMSLDESGGLWCSSRDGSVRRWGTGRLTGEYVLRPFAVGLPHCLVPDGDDWIILSLRGELARADALGQSVKTSVQTAVGVGRSLAWDSSAARAVVAGTSGVAAVDAAGSVLWSRVRDDGMMGANAAAMDGSLVVVGTETGMVRWIDPATGAQVREVSTGLGAIRSVSTRAGRIAVGTAAGSVAIIEADERVHSAQVHAGVDSWRVIFSPDGKRLFSAGEDGALIMLDAETLTVLAKGVGHSGAVLAIDCSPDGSRVATGGFDNTVRVWESRSLEEVLRLNGHIAAVSGVAFSEDGMRLASVANDGTMRVYESLGDESPHK
ncbi:MAG: WD40 repeat domain-containing protein [Phycisphaerales bacterium]